jgi:hypothetical protein
LQVTTIIFAMMLARRHLPWLCTVHQALRFASLAAGRAVSWRR